MARHASRTIVNLLEEELAAALLGSYLDPELQRKYEASRLPINQFQRDGKSVFTDSVQDTEAPGSIDSIVSHIDDSILLARKSLKIGCNAAANMAMYPHRKQECTTAAWFSRITKKLHAKASMSAPCDEDVLRSSNAKLSTLSIGLDDTKQIVWDGIEEFANDCRGPPLSLAIFPTFGLSVCIFLWILNKLKHQRTTRQQHRVFLHNDPSINHQRGLVVSQQPLAIIHDSSSVYLQIDSAATEPSLSPASSLEHLQTRWQAISRREEPQDQDDILLLAHPGHSSIHERSRSRSLSPTALASIHVASGNEEVEPSHETKLESEFESNSDILQSTSIQSVLGLRREASQSHSPRFSRHASPQSEEVIIPFSLPEEPYEDHDLDKIFEEQEEVEEEEIAEGEVDEIKETQATEEEEEIEVEQDIAIHNETAPSRPSNAPIIQKPEIDSSPPPVYTTLLSAPSILDKSRRIPPFNSTPASRRRSDGLYNSSPLNTGIFTPTDNTYSTPATVTTSPLGQGTGLLQESQETPSRNTSNSPLQTIAKVIISPLATVAELFSPPASPIRARTSSLSPSLGSPTVPVWALDSPPVIFEEEVDTDFVSPVRRGKTPVRIRGFVRGIGAVCADCNRIHTYPLRDRDDLECLSAESHAELLAMKNEADEGRLQRRSERIAEQRAKRARRG